MWNGSVAELANVKIEKQRMQQLFSYEIISYQ